MKYIYSITFLFFGIFATVGATNYLWVTDEGNIWAKVRTEHTDAEIYRFVDQQYPVVCYLAGYDKNAIPDMECVNVSTSTVR